METLKIKNEDHSHIVSASRRLFCSMAHEYICCIGIFYQVSKIELIFYRLFDVFPTIIYRIWLGLYVT